jgi:DNA mismatch repair protein MSH6
MDELGRGTSTFDGTAIASAAILHLVERSRCLSLFATHYHSLLNEWQGHPNVLLGHMKCVVENEAAMDRESDDAEQVGMITFLYLLGEGGCPKSFGINVARLARLPQEVIVAARQASTDFERTLKSRMTGNDSEHERLMMEAINSGSWVELMQLHESLK